MGETKSKQELDIQIQNLLLYMNNIPEELI